MKRPGTLSRRRKAKRAETEVTASDRWIAEIRRQRPLGSLTESGLTFQTVGHHIVPQQTLEKKLSNVVESIRVAYLWDVRNGLHLTKRRHERHHSGHEPIRRHELPPAVFEFAAELGLTWYLDRHYPKET